MKLEVEASHLDVMDFIFSLSFMQSKALLGLTTFKLSANSVFRHNIVIANFFFFAGQIHLAQLDTYWNI